MAHQLPSIERVAELPGGEACGEQVLAPGPGHSAEDRSLSVKLDDDAADGFVINTFSGDDVAACRDHVRQKLGLPKFERKEKKRKGKGTAAKPWSPIVARYVYRQADGTPYLQVCRTAAKDFFQNHWNGQLWVTGKPKGPKQPYRLPELLAAPAVTPIHITEGEKDADNLAKLGFIATTNSEGASNWTDDLNEYFRGRIVYLLRTMTNRDVSGASALRAPFFLSPREFKLFACPDCRPRATFRTGLPQIPPVRG